jgi:hypothetical protein
MTLMSGRTQSGTVPAGAAGAGWTHACGNIPDACSLLTSDCLGGSVGLEDSPREFPRRILRFFCAALVGLTRNRGPHRNPFPPACRQARWVGHGKALGPPPPAAAHFSRSTASCRPDPRSRFRSRCDPRKFAGTTGTGAMAPLAVRKAVRSDFKQRHPGMCNAANHSRFCPCGFGGDTGGGGRRGRSDSGSVATIEPVSPQWAVGRVESYITPTTCPVCREPVWFYRSPYPDFTN